MRIVTIFLGILLIGTGVWCFAHPGAPFVSIAFILGIAMLFSGLGNLFTYVVYQKRISYVSWQLAEGLLTAIFALIVLSNAILTDVMIVMFFGMWIQFSGPLRITASADIRRERIAGWYWPLLTGALSLLAGIYCFFNPLLAGLAFAIMIGGIFILQGANNVVSGVLLGSGSQQWISEEIKEQQTESHGYEAEKRQTERRGYESAQI